MTDVFNNFTCKNIGSSTSKLNKHAANLPSSLFDVKNDDFRNLGGAKVRESSAVTITLVLHPDSGQFSLESPEQKVNIAPRVVGSMFLLQWRLVWRLLPTEEKLNQQTGKGAAGRRFQGGQI